MKLARRVFLCCIMLFLFGFSVVEYGLFHCTVSKVFPVCPTVPAKDLVLRAAVELHTTVLWTSNWKSACKRGWACFALSLRLCADCLHKGPDLSRHMHLVTGHVTHRERRRWAERVDADGMSPPAPRSPDGLRGCSGEGFVLWGGQGNSLWDAPGAEPWSRQGSPPWHAQGEGAWHAQGEGSWHAQGGEPWQGQGGEPWQGQGVEAWDAASAGQAGPPAQAGGADGGTLGWGQSGCNTWVSRSSGHWPSLDGMPPPQADRSPGPRPPRASPRGLCAPARASEGSEPSPARWPGPNPSGRSMRGDAARSHAAPGAQPQPGAWRSGFSEDVPARAEDVLARAAAIARIHDGLSLLPDTVPGAAEGGSAQRPACPYLAQGLGPDPADADRRDAALHILCASLQRSADSAAQRERGQQRLRRAAAGQGEAAAAAPGRSASSAGSPSSSTGSERSAAGAGSPDAGRATLNPLSSPGHGGERSAAGAGAGGRRGLTAVTPGPALAAADLWHGPGAHAAAPRQELASLQAWQGSVGHAAAHEPPRACFEAQRVPLGYLPPEPPHDTQDSMRWIDHPAAGAPRQWDASLPLNPNPSTGAQQDSMRWIDHPAAGAGAPRQWDAALTPNPNPSTGGTGGEADPVSGWAEVEGAPLGGWAAGGLGSGGRSTRDRHGAERGGSQAEAASLRGRQTARCSRGASARGLTMSRTYAAEASELLRQARIIAGGAVPAVRGANTARAHAINLVTETLDRSLLQHAAGGAAPNVPVWSGTTIDTSDFVPGPHGMQIHAAHSHFASQFMAEAMERSNGTEPESGVGFFPPSRFAVPKFMGVAVRGLWRCATPAMAAALLWLPAVAAAPHSL